jgi:hypothetical protein
MLRFCARASPIPVKRIKKTAADLNMGSLQM